MMRSLKHISAGKYPREIWLVGTSTPKDLLLPLMDQDVHLQRFVADKRGDGNDDR